MLASLSPSVATSAPQPLEFFLKRITACTFSKANHCPGCEATAQPPVPPSLSRFCCLLTATHSNAKRDTHTHTHTHTFSAAFQILLPAAEYVPLKKFLVAEAEDTLPFLSDVFSVSANVARASATKT